jgi:hypothetical protein
VPVTIQNLASPNAKRQGFDVFRDSDDLVGTDQVGRVCCSVVSGGDDVALLHALRASSLAAGPLFRGDVGRMRHIQQI